MPEEALALCLCTSCQIQGSTNFVQKYTSPDFLRILLQHKLCGGARRCEESMRATSGIMRDMAYRQGIEYQKHNEVSRYMWIVRPATTDIRYAQYPGQRVPFTFHVESNRQKDTKTNQVSKTPSRQYEQ